MEIYLIRHGNCYNSTMDYYSESKRTMDPPLTELGIQQANKLSAKLSDIPFDRIYCSDLIRAVQTAEIVNSTVQTELEVSPDLREIEMGALFEKSWDAYPEIYNLWKLHQQDIAYPEGENGQDVWQRCKKVMDQIITKGYERVAIVSHGGAIRSMLCGVLDIPQVKRFYFGAPIENCSVSIIKYMDGQFYLHSMNK